MRNPSELPRLEAESDDPTARAFLRAELHWHRHRASRIRLVNGLAGGGLFLWFLLALAPGPSGQLHRAVLAAWAICFLASGLAWMLELRWSLRRRRLAARLVR